MISYFLKLAVVLALVCSAIALPVPEDEQGLKKILYATTGAPRVEPETLLEVLKKLQAIYSTKSDPESVKELEQVKKFIGVTEMDNLCFSEAAEDLNKMIKVHDSNQSYHMNLAAYLKHYRDQQLLICERVHLGPAIDLLKHQSEFNQSELKNLEALKVSIEAANRGPIYAPYFDINSTDLFQGIQDFLQKTVGVKEPDQRCYDNQFDRAILNSCRRIQKSSLNSFKLYNLAEDNMSKLKKENLNWLVYVSICKHLRVNESNVKKMVFQGGFKPANQRNTGGSAREEWDEMEDRF